MHNVYDLIADFYGNSNEWGEWLSRRYADDFIRMEAFHGAGEDELYDTTLSTVSAGAAVTSPTSP